MTVRITNDDTARAFLAETERLDGLDIIERDGAVLVAQQRYCTRCNGSGHYSFNPRTGTVCFQCSANPRRMAWIEEVPIVTFARRAKAADARRSAKARKAEARAAQREQDRAAFLAQHADLDLDGDHNVLRDLRSSLEQWGSLTDRQVALARKIGADLAAREAEVNVPAPEGRHDIEGRVLSVKWSTSAFGDHCRVTLRVEADGGVWIGNGTLPRSIDPDTVERGDTLRLKATVVRGREEHFAFLKRPTGATLAKAG